MKIWLDDSTAGGAVMTFLRVVAKLHKRLAYPLTRGNANQSKDLVANVNNAVRKLQCGQYTLPKKKK